MRKAQALVADLAPLKALMGSFDLIREPISFRSVGAMPESG